MTQEQKEAVRNLLTKIRTAGYVGVSIGFEGSGDSGDLQGYCLFKEEDGFQLHECYAWETDHGEFAYQELKPLEDLFYAVDNSSGEDWYNNDGGYGSVNINLLTGEIKANYHIRYTETNYSEHDYQAKEFTR